MTSEVKIVGVLNITPDSFSDGGDFLLPENALKRAEKMLKQGADIIDVGAESTAPHNAEISKKEEWKRLEKILPILFSQNIPLSLDSQKAGIWEKFLENGGEMINDVSGMRREFSEKIRLLKKFPKAKIVIMYTRDISHPDPENFPEKILPEISEFFETQISRLTQEGIGISRIILDPGMGGFLSKNPEISFTVLRELSQLKKFKCALYVGTSRKSFLAEISGNCPPHQRVISSVVSSLAAAQNGVSYIRVHDVQEMTEALKIWKKVM